MTDYEYWMSCVLDSIKIVMSINNEDLDKSLAEHLQEPHSIESDCLCCELMQLLNVPAMTEESKMNFASLLKCHTFLLFCQLLLTTVLQVSNYLLVLLILHYFKY